MSANPPETPLEFQDGAANPILSAQYISGQPAPASITRLAPPRWIGGLNRELDVAQGLVSAMPLWEGSGVNVRDYALERYINFGTSATWDYTELGPTLLISKEFQIIAQTDAISLFDFSVSLWMRPNVTLTSTSDPHYGATSLYAIEGNNTQNFEIELVYGNLETGNYVSSGNGNCLGAFGAFGYAEAQTTAAPANNWYNMVLVMSKGVFSSYTNGWLNTSRNANPDQPLIDLQIWLGGVQGGNVPARWQGHLSNFLLYNRALSNGEVLSLFRDPWQLYRKSPSVTFYDNLWIDGVGGAVCNGSAPMSLAYVATTTGVGAVGGGTARVNVDYSLTTTGRGGVGGGAANYRAIFGPATTGKGAVGGGTAIQSDIDQSIITGVGSVGGGKALANADYNPTTTGNGAVGGDGAFVRVIHTQLTTGNGGLGGGAAIVGHAYEPPVTGVGSLGGGAAHFLFEFGPTPSGGVLGGGLDDNGAVYNITGSGGALGGGLAELSDTIPMQGGIVGGGTGQVFTDYNIQEPDTAEGVLLSSVDTFEGFVFNYVGSGGMIGSGHSGHTVDTLMLGGIVDGGSAPNDVGLAVVVNTFFAGGTAPVQLNYNPTVLAAGALGGSSAPNNQQHVYFWDASGGPEVTSGASFGMASVAYHASGAIIVSNPSPGTDINFGAYTNLTFSWHIKSQIVKDLTFLWNDGQLPIYWYRVIGQSNPNCPLDPCCQQFIVNISARTLSELCDKLASRNYNFQIQSVEKFSQPAETSVLAANAAAGLSTSCNTLVPVTICSVPQCAQFCIQEDLFQTIAFGMTVQVNSIDFYQATGQIFVTGAATTSFTINRPAFSATGSGSVTMSGAASVQTDSYAGSGGAVLGGSAYTESTTWVYEGGRPFDESISFGLEAESIAERVSEEPWSLTEYVTGGANGSYYSSTDISFGNASELLVVRDFNLSVPDWAELIGLYVRVDRLATQISVRDAEIYLVMGDDIISDNLADTVNDWPLILTPKIYGSNGFYGNGGTGWTNAPYDGFATDISVDQVNDPNFGVAIKVYARNSLPATVAKVNLVLVKAIYNDPQGSIVRMSGSAVCQGPTYYYTASGVEIFSHTDATTYKAGFNFVSNGLNPAATAAVQPTGHAAITYNEVMDGSGVLGGEAVVEPYFEIPLGGATLGGSALVLPYVEVGSGGAVANGTATMGQTVFYQGRSGLVGGGSAYVPLAIFRQVASGSVVVTGTAPVVASAWQYTWSGGIDISGSADQRSSMISTPLQDFGFGMLVISEQTQFDDDVDLDDLVAPNTTVDNECGCIALPMILDMTHNLNRDNVLAQFLARNNITMPSVLQLLYNQVNDSWQANLHYTGYAPDANNLETWVLTFEVQCTNTMGGISIGRTIWKVAIQVFRINDTTGEELASRVILGIIPDNLCGATGDHLDMEITYNTLLNFSTVDVNTTIYQNTLFDDIGLFRNPGWTSDPDLTLTISRSVGAPVTRINLTSSVLV